jgi:hypothetical protein
MKSESTLCCPQNSDTGSTIFFPCLQHYRTYLISSVPSFIRIKRMKSCSDFREVWYWNSLRIVKIFQFNLDWRIAVTTQYMKIYIRFWENLQRNSPNNYLKEKCFRPNSFRKIEYVFYNQKTLSEILTVFNIIKQTWRYSYTSKFVY